LNGGSVAAGAVLDVVIERLSSEGAGVGRLADGRTVFVHRTAPGDRTRIELSRMAARWARGRLLEVIEPGPLRRVAPCPHYARCGGCSLQHLEYGAQLSAKADLVVQALGRIGRIRGLPEPRIHPSPHEFGYRNRVTFALLRAGGGRIVAGFHELEKPARVVDIDERCLLPEPAILRVWEALRTNWGAGARRLPSGRELRLTLRTMADGTVMLIVRGGRGPGDPEALLGKVPGLSAIWHEPGVAGMATLLGGTADIREEWLGETMTLEPGAFLQVNRELAVKLHQTVLTSLGRLDGVRLVDAYCGTGIYGRIAADRGARSIGIELDPGAVRMADEAHRSGGIAGSGGSFRVLEGRVSDRLGEALPADVVILNPPRTGCEPAVMEQIAGALPSRIVYASCDPATLARDVALLGSGYQVASLDVFDLFPQTAHVETILTLDGG